MAEWEPLAGLVCAVISLTAWAPWYADVFRVNRLTTPMGFRLVLGLTPFFCLLFLLLCVATAAPKAIRESGLHVLIHMTLRTAALGVSAQLYPFLGVSARDDVLERHNAAGLIVVVGGLIGTVLCFAGGSIGLRPGVGAAIASGGMALCTWFVLWYVTDSLSGRGIAEQITVERDIGSGLRLASLLVANGIILGAASQGNWTLYHFAVSAWPALAVTLMAALAERFFGSGSFIGRSLLVTSGYLLVAILWVLHRRFEK